jgi:hypothetical protein
VRRESFGTADGAILAQEDDGLGMGVDPQPPRLQSGFHDEITICPPGILAGMPLLET